MDPNEFCRGTKKRSTDEIAQALEKMQDLKFYPRDELGNQELVLFAERVVGEVNPHERESLESAIDRLEESMETNDRDLFAMARRDLLITLSGLGFEYRDEGASGG